MGDKTAIQWADATWNPITGCTPISDGCAMCYAKALITRFPLLHTRSSIPKPFERLYFHQGRLETPLKWKKPRRIFVCSMSDLFHDQIPFERIDQVFEVIDRCPQHTFMLLTKRPKRALEYFSQGEPGVFPYKNVWMGVTTENYTMADERLPVLLDIPATVRFVSIEPMLGPVELFGKHRDYLHDLGLPGRPPVLKGIDWVIIGAESGPGRRPCKIEWMVDVVEQCKAANVPVFVKQIHDGFGRVVKNIEDFPKELQFREFPQSRNNS